MAFLYDYMSKLDLRLMQESALFDNALAHLNTEFNTILAVHERTLNDIETKVILESCDEDDLTSMYMEETEMFLEEAKGWWAKFKAWIRGIIDAILGKTTQIKEKLKGASAANEVIEVEVEPSKVKSILTKGRTLAKKLLNFKKDGGELNKEKIAAALGISAAVLGGSIYAGLKKGGKKKTITPQQAAQVVQEVDQQVKGLEQDIEAVAEAATEAAPEAQSTIRTVLSQVLKFAQDFKNALLSKLSRKGKGEPEEETPAKMRLKATRGKNVKSMSVKGNALKRSDLRALKSEQFTNSLNSTGGTPRIQFGGPNNWSEGPRADEFDTKNESASSRFYDDIFDDYAESAYDDFDIDSLF